MRKHLHKPKVWSKPRAKNTCLECGFLALDDNELSYTDRMLLHTHLSGRSMGLPNWQKIWCTKGLWVFYETTYVEPAFEGLEAELSKLHDNCPEWYRYKPGYSPQKHFTFQERAWSVKANRRTVAIGAAVGGVVGAFVAWLIHFVANT